MNLLIVGMGPGLSLGVAQRFAREGFSIGMIGRNEEALKQFAAQVPGRSAVGVADAGNEDDLITAIRRCEGELGATDVLVYNAALWEMTPLADVTGEKLRRSFAINVAGALTAVQAVLPGMRAAGRGSVLLTGGGLALYPAPKLGTLAIGKSGLRSLALTLAKELSPEGIHVATITICGMIQAGTFFAPDRIAEVYWTLHAEEPSHFRSEVIYKEQQ
jgi:NAD(P)-dependent dehydrogenase (short-subunit alcohol dehydrogenase family)